MNVDLLDIFSVILSILGIPFLGSFIGSLPGFNVTFQDFSNVIQRIKFNILTKLDQNNEKLNEKLDKNNEKLDYKIQKIQYNIKNLDTNIKNIKEDIFDLSCIIEKLISD